MNIFRHIAVVLLLVAATACGDDIDRDATKVAESSVELTQLRQRMANRSNLAGQPVSRQEVQRFEQKHIELFNQMSEKYGSSPEQWKDFQQRVNKKINELER